MLAVPPLVGALGKLFVRDIGTRPDLPIWGDGRVQQSLAELYSPLRFYADLAVGSRRLLRQARGAGKSGRAKLVRARGQGMSQPYVWNQRAAKEIDARLQHIMRN